MKPHGMVYLVGAGPGDAGLFTMRGAELLSRADVVVHDALVNPELLRLAPKSAEVICDGKGGRNHAMPQKDLDELVIAKAREGKKVVRLKGGDVCVSGHSPEEIKRLADAGIPFEVVRGIPSELATPGQADQSPLRNQRVVVTRTREQAGQLSGQLQALGAEVLEVPTIRLDPPTHREAVVDVLLELNSYDWLVFTSPNGVTRFFEYFFKQFHDMRDIGGARFAAVGPATANKLKELHLQVDLMPNEALAGEIAEAFSEFESIENLKICLLRAEVANPELPAALEALGAIVDDIAVYKTVPETEDPSGAAAKLVESGADWVTFTSASTVENFHARFDLPGLLKKFPQMKIASIGPETSKALLALGLKPAVQARQHTMEGLIEALIGSSKFEVRSPKEGRNPKSEG